MVDESCLCTACLVVEMYAKFILDTYIEDDKMQGIFDLKGKRALVTGSTQGIGKAIASILAENGAEVIIHGSSSEEKCRMAAKEMKGTPQIAVADLSESDCAEKLYAQTGDVDILVLNASVQIRKAWDEITLEEFDIQMNTNLKSSLLLTQKYVPHMKEQNWGRVLMVGSVQQYKPHKDMAIYAASKCGQMSLVTNLAKQLAPFGITVNNLCPGVIVTPRNDAVLSDSVYAKQVMAGIPLGYAGDPNDMAAAALLFCSDGGRYITGTELIVDGGMHL